jgi:hypothetical protein
MGTHPPPTQTPNNPGMPMNGSGVTHAPGSGGGDGGGVGLVTAEMANG